MAAKKKTTAKKKSASAKTEKKKKKKTAAPKAKAKAKKAKPKPKPKTKAATPKKKKKKAAKPAEVVNKTDGGGRWAKVAGFLKREWAAFVADEAERGGTDATPPPSSRTSRARSVGNIAAAFALWGRKLPADLQSWLAPLETHACPPSFARMLSPGSMALSPASSSGINCAEARILAAQEYAPLWMELFAGAIEIGAATPAGDLWMYGAEATKPGPIAPYHLANNLLGDTQADSLEALVFRAALVPAHDGGVVDDKTFAKGVASLNGHVGTLYFEAGARQLAGLSKPFAVDGGIALEAFIFQRAEWLIALLSRGGARSPSDSEIRNAFRHEKNPPIDKAYVTTREAMLRTYPPTTFYSLWSLYFAGDEEVLRAALTACRTGTEVPIIRDLVVIVDELLDGRRKALGSIEDMPALRERVQALHLFTRAASEAEAIAAVDAAENAGRSLEQLAYEHLNDPMVLAAIEERWSKSSDAALASSVAMKRSLKDKQRYDENVERFLKEADDRVLPLLIGHGLSLTDESGMRLIALHVISEWGKARAIGPIASITRLISPFNHERFYFATLVHGAAASTPTMGTPEAAAAASSLVAGANELANILMLYPPRVEGADRADRRNEMLANVTVVLGDLRVASARATLVRWVDTTVDDLGTNTPIGLRDAVLYALGELGAIEVLPNVLERSTPFEPCIGLYWALGTLAAVHPDEVARTDARARLDAAQVTSQTVEDSAGNVRPETVASLFDENYRGQEKSIAREIAIQSGRVLLGADDDILREVVTEVLSTWARRSEEGIWSGYNAYGMLSWALIALRHHPTLGPASLAAPFVASKDPDDPVVRSLARRVVGSVA